MRLALAVAVLGLIMTVPMGSASDVESPVGEACLETSTSSAHVNVGSCTAAVEGTVEWVGHFLSP